MRTGAKNKEKPPKRTPLEDNRVSYTKHKQMLDLKSRELGEMKRNYIHRTKDLEARHRIDIEQKVQETERLIAQLDDLRAQLDSGK